MICERCGRLLNRATGKCNVCEDHGGAAPPPVATTTAAAGPEAPDAPAVGADRPPRLDPGERSVAATLRPATPAGAPAPGVPVPGRPAGPPPAAPGQGPAGPGGADAGVPTPSLPVPAPAPAPDQPISVSAAVAILDLSDPEDKPKRFRKTTPPLSEEQRALPPPRAPGAPVGVVRGGRMGRRKVDLVAYDGNLVLARRGAPENLTSGQLAAQDPNSRILAAEAVDEAIVREDAVSGQVRIKTRVGDDVVVRWPGWKNRGVSAENLLAHSFPGKVDQGSPEIAQRTVRVMGLLGGAILVAVVAYLGLSALLKGDPPPPPPPAPTTTLAPPEQAARTALQQACPAWREFAGGVPIGDRPNPTAMKPVVDGMRPWFVAAADAGADPIYTTARDEVAYLQEYAARPAADVARESVSRVNFAMRTVTSACDRAMG